MSTTCLVKGHGPTAKSQIRAMRKERLGWHVALGELIDNSIGNGASHVEVRIAYRDGVWVRDDAVGCDPNKLAAIVSLGWHEEDERVTNSVSLYGQGATKSCIWLGGPTEVYSLRDNEYRSYIVDWDAFEELWDYPDPVEGEPARKMCEHMMLGTSGVTIRLPETRHLQPSQFDELFTRLANDYWLAVDAGVSIDVRYRGKGVRRDRGGLLPTKPLPSFIEDTVIDTVAHLSDGREIRLHGGVLDPKERMTDPGFEYIFGHRVIISAGRTGAGELDYGRVYVRVYLMGDKTDWQVDTHKTGLQDVDESMVGEAVFNQCKNMLTRAASEDYAQLQDAALCDELSTLLTTSNRKKAKRGPRTGTRPGAVKPTGTGSPHGNAKETGDEDGGCLSKKTSRVGRVFVRRQEFGDADAHLVGKASAKDRTIRLNARHPHIERGFKTNDRKSLLEIAYAIWSDEWPRTDDNGQRRIDGMTRGTFIEKYSAMLKDLPDDLVHGNGTK